MSSTITTTRASSVSAELIVAKASLSGALFRSDPRGLGRDEIEDALALIHTATTQCTPANVQKCKKWALENLVPSTNRLAPFGKYLAALSNSFVAPENESENGSAKPPMKPSTKRRRLYVLYILNDIMFHAKYRLGDETLAEKLEGHLVALVRSASSFSHSPKHIEKVQGLISIWEEKQYFRSDAVEKLRQAVKTAVSIDNSSQNPEEEGSTESHDKRARSTPFIMPAMHGDPATPWYDLPAGNWLSVLEPNSTRPMNPAMVKPLQLNPGPADKSLADAVQKLLVDVDRIYGIDQSEDGAVMDIGPMGERVEYDEINKDIVGGDTYYGWSYEFCRKMKARRNQPDKRDSRSHDGSSRSVSRSRSRSRTRRRSLSRDSSRGSSRPAFKRTRRSLSSRRDNSSSRSRSRSRGRGLPYGRRERSYTSSRSRSRSPDGNFRMGNRSESQGRSRSRAYSPPPPDPPSATGLPPRPQPPGPPFPPQPWAGPPPSGPFPNFGNGFHIPGFPAPPPPPPPNFQGQWQHPAAPVPNPLPPGGLQQNYFTGMASAAFGGWANHVPPPPPPPPRNDFQYGRGGGGWRGNGGGPGIYGRGKNR